MYSIKRLRQLERSRQTADNGDRILSETARVLTRLSMTLALALAMLIHLPFPARATQWELASSVGNDLHQYVDLDSIRLSPSLRRIASYFTDASGDELKRTDYTTLYDCDRRVFKDLSENGDRAQMDWMAPIDDPLNLGAMNFVCALDGDALLERQS
ncbi:MAG: hypothetical protein AAFX40_15705 [Cyanobacteria bacterium J06639_1]